MTTAYRDWQGRKIQVSDQTLEAVLAVLGSAPPSAPARPGAAADRVSVPLAAPWHPADHPAAPSGPRSGWGFTVQLYSVRSRRSWGHGDLRDLADLATWSGRELGAAFVLINPLHAAEPVPPVSASPYLPMSRRFVSPLYLRVEDIPEYALLPSAQRQRIAALAAPLRARNSSPALIDRDAVWTAKRAALEIVQDWPLAARPARRLPAVHRPRGPGAGRLGHLVRARGDPRARLAVVAGGPAVAAVGDGGRRAARGCTPGSSSTPGCNGPPRHSGPRRRRRRGRQA